MRFCRNVHAGEQLVDDLDLAAVAGTVAELVDIGGHRIERLANLRVGLGAARRHHRHLSRGSLGGAARNRRIQVEQSNFGQAPLERHRPVGVDGGAHHEHAAGCQRGGGTAFAEQHGFGLRGIDHDAHHHAALRGHFGRTSAGNAALGSEGLGGLGTYVEHVHAVARAAQRPGHALSHGPEADHSDVLTHGVSCPALLSFMGPGSEATGAHRCRQGRAGRSSNCEYGAGAAGRFSRVAPRIQRA